MKQNIEYLWRGKYEHELNAILKPDAINYRM